LTSVEQRDEAPDVLTAGITDVGLTRRDNQDSFGGWCDSDGRYLLLVADGLGGHRGGATASRLAVEVFEDIFAGAEELAGDVVLLEGFEAANAKIFQVASGDRDLKGMGTTGVGLFLDMHAPAPSGWLAHVGDSRCYRLREGVFECLTLDHTLRAQLREARGATTVEIDAVPGADALMRALGPEPEVEVDVKPLSLQAGDRFLLCSDGLWGPVPDEDTADILARHDPEDAVELLVDEANRRGGPDNVTILIAVIPGGDASDAATVIRRSAHAPAASFPAATPPGASQMTSTAEVAGLNAAPVAAAESARPATRRARGSAWWSESRDRISQQLEIGMQAAEARGWLRAGAQIPRWAVGAAAAAASLTAMLLVMVLVQSRSLSPAAPAGEPAPVAGPTRAVEDGAQPDVSARQSSDDAQVPAVSTRAPDAAPKSEADVEVSTEAELPKPPEARPETTSVAAGERLGEDEALPTLPRAKPTLGFASAAERARLMRREIESAQQAFPVFLDAVRACDLDALSKLTSSFAQAALASRCEAAATLEGVEVDESSWRWLQPGRVRVQFRELVAGQLSSARAVLERDLSRSTGGLSTPPASGLAATGSATGSPQDPESAQDPDRVLWRVIRIDALGPEPSP